MLFCEASSISFISNSNNKFCILFLPIAWLRGVNFLSWLEIISPNTEQSSFLISDFAATSRNPKACSSFFLSSLIIFLLMPLQVCGGGRTLRWLEGNAAS